MLRKLASIGRAALCALACVACSDGVGVPIRLGALEQDGAVDRDELDQAHCATTLAWPDEYAQDEAALLEAINQRREEPLRCGDDQDGVVDELRPLQLSEALRCSARLHSLDMVERDFIGRTNPDGERPGDRMRAAGFAAEDWDESLAIEELGPQGVLDSLLEDGDDCRNVATRRHTHIGIGRYEDLWTLDFARD